MTIFHIGKVRVYQAIALHERNPSDVTGLFRSKTKKMILPESFLKHKILGFTVNNQLVLKSFDWLIQYKNYPSCIGVYVNHDPAVQEQKLEVHLSWRL